MKRNSIERNCANCVFGRSNRINNDILCSINGIVTSDYVCSRHAFKAPGDRQESAETGVPSKKEGPVVCLIAEGSYPYVTGGVSGWIQMLMNWLPEYRFIIYAIGAEDKSRGKYVYKLPPNVIGVQEVFLNTFLTEKAEWGKRFNLSREEMTAVGKVLTGRDSNMEDLFDVIRKMESVSDFILSKDFFDILTWAYKEKFSQVSFLDFFWSVRSMVLPLFNLIRQPVPEADIYHSVSAGYAGVIGALCKHVYKKPYVLTEHGIYTREREEEIIKSTWVKGHFKDMWIDLFYNFSRCAYNSADKVVTLFSRNGEMQIEIGCPPEKLQVIPNGVDLKEFKGSETPVNKKDRISIGAVVRIVPIKDIKTMIHAFAIVKEEVPEAEFYIMGPTDEDEEYYKECETLVSLLEINDLHFTGRVNVRECLGDMDILVLSSISEGQPLAVLEGMAFKKPFVTTDVGSCRELLEGNNDIYGDAGLVVPVMDYIKIAQGIIKLCMDEPLRKKMGENGYNRVCALYTLEGFIESYRKIYSEYVDGGQ